MIQVAILMGSASDKPIVAEGEKILQSFDVTFESKVLSAHRSPHLVVEYVTESTQNGVLVFICAAGMAAHLAGVCAAHTIRPVIGIPIDGGFMGGMDALLATVQMPKGVPVATVAVGKSGAKNAAILAVQIIALQDKNLSERLVQFKEEMIKDVQKQNA